MFQYFEVAPLTNAGFEELAAYSLVHTNGFGYFLHVSSGGLAESADAVDAADSLSQEGVGCLRAQQEGTLIHQTWRLLVVLSALSLQLS